MEKAGTEWVLIDLKTIAFIFFNFFFILFYFVILLFYFIDFFYLFFLQITQFII